ncbi:hypothetical protein SERLA73DRAFT_180038 [Serpula lacrymans var. lacrymans S7.3]|uniref:Uncharacterized protein n=2 Tax=Serpula lacrymans var. lacrymans TaxID=341189 RepID=F8PVJ9_SERL3|nr:uncharacterized protein SERLADRAFT_465456 [Serpula lacrymans var. lacrymans S7.9]EGN99816.1 hypothetical protein SERLA73DRAFT_180038 [Serpula lacrymans var. lacrymans S7.3]EGO25386.1 hypothetical protein SERLADRAFT_465456 [Serpula lacrymans var. lacrymans S7.9]
MFPSDSSETSSDSCTLVISDTSSRPCTPSPISPTKSRRPPVPLRLQSVGIDPSLIVGKVLTRISRSPKHPTLTLDFSDHTTFQILVDGYDPVYRGVPKRLEMDHSLETLMNTPTGQVHVELTIEDCALITLTDKAFEMKQKEERWDQNHTGVALRFKEDRAWHCVWATLAEHDEKLGACIFRSYDDVYLDRLQRSPRKRRSRAPSSPTKGKRGTGVDHLVT